MKGKTHMKRKILTAAAVIMSVMTIYTGCGKENGSDKESSSVSIESSSGKGVVESSTDAGADSSSGKAAPEITEAPKEIKVVENPAVYLGIKDYASMKKEGKDSFKYRFFMDGEEKLFSVAADNDYKIQNLLKEGSIYSLELDGETVKGVTELTEDAAPEGVIFGLFEEVEVGLTDKTKIYNIDRKAGGSTVNNDGHTDVVYYCGILNLDGSVREMYYLPDPVDYDPVVKGVPGEKTLKNLIATALMPNGCVNYVYGGGWDWQDEGSSVQCRSIGLAGSWTDFFFSNAGNYSYKPDYYPNGGWNEYYYAGLDCSGYIGWVIYNVMNTTDGGEGYVMGSTKMAGNFAERGWGTATTNFKVSDFKPGDIFSMKGHVWMCIGTCSDGSMVIAHSTPSASRQGKEGGGVQLSALGASKDCEAYKLADKYMSEYPAWYSVYDVALKKYGDYTAVTGAATGKFSWKLDGGILTDPDGIAGMSAAEVLKTIYGK